jgi:hypothetical protein
MKLSQMFPRRYATGEDLQGKAITLTIASIILEKMHPQANAPEVEKWVLYFKEAKKGVVLNRTMAYQIGEFLGSEDTDDWVGKSITIYPQPMTVAGRKVTAIRARAAKGRPGATGESIPSSLAEEDDDDEIPD